MESLRQWIIRHFFKKKIDLSCKEHEGRRIFHIDIGDIPLEKQEECIEKLRQQLKQTPFINPETGDYNLTYKIQPFNMEDDKWWFFGNRRNK